MNPFAPRKYGELHRVTDRVYIYRNITNSSFVIGDRGVAVIDTQVNLPTAHLVLNSVRSVTDKPILYAINTHYHWDHTHGNALFKKEGAEIVSSRLTREFMTVRAQRQKAFLSGRGFELGNDPLLPESIFENETSLDLGGMTLRLFFAGKAESDDATAIHVPSEGVVMSGDTVMTGSFPIFGQPVWDEGLQDEDWIRTIENLRSLKSAHIIPGHGPLAYEEELDLLIRIQRYFLDEVRRCVDRGLDINAILKDLEPRLPEWIRRIPLVWGTPRYAILRVWRALTRKPSDEEPGWQKFKPSAIPGAGQEASHGKINASSVMEEYFQAARECAEGGDAAQKIALLEKAAQLFSHCPQAHSTLADALIESSRQEGSVLEKGDFFQKARACWQRALTLDPSHAPSLLGKGRYLVMMAYRGGEDPREGMETIRQAIAFAQNDEAKAEAEFYLGMGYRRLGDEMNAKAQFSKSLNANPAFMPASMALEA